MKVLSPRAHGVLDYATVVFFALAPSIFNMGGIYATVCYALAGSYLVITLLTDFQMGIAHLIPFRVHGWLELVSGLVLLASPFIFGFQDDSVTARNFFMAMGGVFLVVWLLTDWQADTHTHTHGSGTLMPNH